MVAGTTGTPSPPSQVLRWTPAAYAASRVPDVASRVPDAAPRTAYAASRVTDSSTSAALTTAGKRLAGSSGTRSESCDLPDS